MAMVVRSNVIVNGLHKEISRFTSVKTAYIKAPTIVWKRNQVPEVRRYISIQNKSTKFSKFYQVIDSG
ncbi:hypothetical protein L2E82_03364 [Cichorium intybus]|uniref:Uncharacterized protein n=1 Tax=Cichorium intybus TaxID=13427 RepID=A0ACB9H3E3_CICIN|nr:hypothetical protein L2E82_03364 [Cichorium intybus]